MFWTITGWIIALLALIVNVLQLFQNRKLKKVIIQIQDSSSTNSSTKQTHSGKGDNITIRGNANITK